jgi:NTE family protein
MPAVDAMMNHATTSVMTPAIHRGSYLRRRLRGSERSLRRVISIAPHASIRAARRDTVIAFVLQGGGSLTACQVGMLRALSEAGVAPDLLVGSSAGALNAVAFAADPTAAGLDRLTDLWMSLRRRHVAPLSVRALAGALTGRGAGIVPATAFRDLLQRGIGVARLQDTTIPVHVIATEFGSGDAVVLSNGDTVAALLASCAYPGLYAPVEIAGQRLIDGGVSADAPVLQAEALGATLTFVLPAATPDPLQAAPRAPLPLAFRALGQILDASARRDAALAAWPVRILPTAVSTANNPVDFRDTARLIEDGYGLATRWLAAQWPITSIDSRPRRTRWARRTAIVQAMPRQSFG